MPGMIIRPATPDDASRIARIDRAAKLAAMPSIVWPRSPAEVRGYIAKVLIPGGGVLVAAARRKILGYMALEPGWVEQLYLDPGHWRRGIGGALLAVAKARNPGGLQLYCFQANAGARAFYERQGFAIAAKSDGAGNEERMPDILYAWQGQPPPPGTAPAAAA
jgi:GNAT superfamily N-acetyltransferase